MSIDELVSGLGQLIDGRVEPTTGRFPVESPSTGEVIAHCPEATIDDANRAVEAAAAAQPAWAAMPLDDRREVIRAMGKAIDDGWAEIALLAAAEKGDAHSSAEGQGAGAMARHTADREVPIEVLEDNDERRVTLVRDPVGVVVAIAPWNAPIVLLTDKIFTALLLGNTVVAKPSPFTPLATLLIAKLWEKVVPPGVVNVIAGDNEVGDAMVRHPQTRMISFTGSVRAGRQIAAAAAPGLKNLLFELGGNDAAIVLDDVDVQRVAERLFVSAFTWSGQICAATKRVYAHRSICDQLVTELAKLADEQIADHLATGRVIDPLATRVQYQRVIELVDDAKASGAAVRSGGEPLDSPGFSFPPTVLCNVGPGFRVVDEEQFGPVLPVIAFDDVEDAIAEANAGDYGLCGSIWTKDLERGAALAGRLECGTAWVNHHTEVSPEVPFGGVKASGIGRNYGKQGLDAYAELKVIIVHQSPDRV